MATIIEFRAASSSSSSTTHRAAGASAEVVIFPGVRYERWQDEQGEKPRRNRSRQRDRLELEE